MDDGNAIYEDDSIVVFAITKPSTPWSSPQFSTNTQGATAAETTNGVGNTKTEARSSSSGSSSESQSASEDVPREEPEIDSNDKGQSTAESSSESDDDSDDGSSESDSDTNKQDVNLQSIQQQQLFRRMDAIFSTGGSSADLVNNIRGSIAEARVQSRQLLQGAGPDQPPKIPNPSGSKPVVNSGQKRAHGGEPAALAQTPKRVRSAMNSQQGRRTGSVVSNSKASSVVVARCATGTISKQSSGASGFLVQIKGSNRLFFMTFATDVRALDFLTVSALN